MRSAAAVAGCLVLATALAACGSNDEEEGRDGLPAAPVAVPAGAKPVEGPIGVTATADACTLSTQAAFAGANVLAVTNSSGEEAEVYVYQGERVVTEREGIKDGEKVDITFEAAEGEYQIACKPGEDDFRTSLALSAKDVAAEADAERAAAVTEYRAYVQAEADKLVPLVTELITAVKAGDVAKAKELYAPSRIPWEGIEPVAESFGDLDPLIDIREADLEPGQEFTGWHRIEKALFTGAGSTAGLDETCDKLLVDIKDLQSRVAAAPLTVTSIGNGAKELLDEVASGKITGEEEAFSHTDLVDFDANVVGAKKAFEVLKPIVAVKDAALVATLETEFANVEKALLPYAEGDGYVSYDTVTEAQRKELTRVVDALSEPLSKLAAAAVA